MTDSLLVEVANVQVDWNKKMFDIKDITPVQSSLGDWWKYLLLAVIIGIGHWFIGS
jgi:hypothetical protein